MELKERQEEKAKMLKLSKAEKNVKQKQRYDTVLLYLEGYTPKEISLYLHIPRRTTDYYILKYKNGGAEALKLKAAPGAKRKLTEEQEAKLIEVISTCTPEAAGIGIFANWTAALACEWVRQHFQQEFSESGMRDLFHRVGLSYTRPTYTLKKADKEKQKAFRETFEGLKRGS